MAAKHPACLQDMGNTHTFTYQCFCAICKGNSFSLWGDHLQTLPHTPAPEGCTSSTKQRSEGRAKSGQQTEEEESRHQLQTCMWLLSDMASMRVLHRVFLLPGLAIVGVGLVLRVPGLVRGTVSHTQSFCLSCICFLLSFSPFLLSLPLSLHIYIYMYLSLSLSRSRSLSISLSAFGHPTEVNPDLQEVPCWMQWTKGPVNQLLFSRRIPNCNPF